MMIALARDNADGSALCRLLWPEFRSAVRMAGGRKRFPSATDPPYLFPIVVTMITLDTARGVLSYQHLIVVRSSSVMMTDCCSYLSAFTSIIPRSETKKKKRLDSDERRAAAGRRTRSKR